MVDTVCGRNAFIRISGIGLAPAELYRADGMSVENRLPQVTVNDQPVSLSYVSPTQISAAFNAISKAPSPSGRNPEWCR
jgi:hypothetical protein